MKIELLLIILISTKSIEDIVWQLREDIEIPTEPEDGNSNSYFLFYLNGVGMPVFGFRKYQSYNVIQPKSGTQPNWKHLADTRF